MSEPAETPKQSLWGLSPVAWIFIGFVAVLVVIMVSALIPKGDDKPRSSGGYFAAALEACKLTTAQEGVRIADGGKTLILSSAGEESSGIPVESVACVLGATKIPEHVAAKMQATRALDGQQAASWEGFEASWTYHPDDGLNIILVDTYRR